MSYGYLTGDDKIVVNRDHILSHAKDMVLDLSNDYSKPEVETSVNSFDQFSD